MLPICYARSRGTAAYMTPFRITANNDGTCTFHAVDMLIGGKRYSIQNDLTFSIPNGAFHGVIYTDPRTGGQALMVVDPALLSETGVEMKPYATGLVRAFVRASYHDGKQEDCIVITTAEDPESFDDQNRWVDQGLPARTAITASAATEADFPPLVQTRVKINAAAPGVAKLEELQKKTWSQLTADEQSFVTQRLAERFGIIAPG